MSVAGLGIGATRAAVQVQIYFQQGGLTVLRTKLLAWVTALGAQIPNATIEQRTLINWMAVGRALVATLPTDGSLQTQLQANEVAVYVYRTCRAAEFAATANRITNAQRIAILNAYNSIWTT